MTKTDDMTSWDAARSASRRPLRKPYKAVGPVGPTHVADGRNDCCCSECVQFSRRACRDCGMHVCGCDPAERDARYRAALQAHMDAHRRHFLEMVGGVELNSVVRGDRDRAELERTEYEHTMLLGGE